MLKHLAYLYVNLFDIVLFRNRHGNLQSPWSAPTNPVAGKTSTSTLQHNKSDETVY